MSLSEETLRELIDICPDRPRLGRLIRTIESETVADHSPLSAAICNALEVGFDPLEMLAAFRGVSDAYADVPAPYRREMPADWLAIRERIFARDGEVCRYCATTDGPFHIDHIAPLRHGGSHDDDNLCVACATCNVSKKDRTPEQWRPVGASGNEPEGAE